MPGLWAGEQVNAETSRARAERAWEELNLTGGWTGRLDDLLTANVFTTRFGQEGRLRPRGTQRVVEQLAADMDVAGLMIIEAPMGEGKTEAALVASEIMAAKFGMDGVFIGLPTQATTDAMFERVKDWLETHWPGTPLGLAHGKSVVNKTLRQMQPWRSSGVHDDTPDTNTTAMAPSEWFEARKRLLLLPFLVGTIDNLLLAGARVRHLPLYHAAFANKVIVLDEVHAADIYMSQFLYGALSWLGMARVPVILLSATLPDPQRKELIAAYSGRDVEMVLPTSRDKPGYPRITLATAGPAGEEVVQIAESDPTRRIEVRIDAIDEPGLNDGDLEDADRQVSVLLENLLSDGGCVLVIRNTVGRAQSLYKHLAERFSEPQDTVVLLHARFTAGHRASSTSELLAKLGKSSEGATRPTGHQRYILVSTQVAEQSLDIDADVLITDLCPIDLLLQRAGRMHRHSEYDAARPLKLKTPQMYVTRMRSAPQALTTGLGFPAEDRYHRFVYPMSLLARSAQIILRHNGRSICIPDDIPALVSQVYDPVHRVLDDEAWRQTFKTYDEQLMLIDGKRETDAKNGCIPRAWDSPKIDGLNRAPVPDDEMIRIVVRDGDISVEAVLLAQLPNERYQTIGAAQELTFSPDDYSHWREGRKGKEAIAAIMASTIRIPRSVLTPVVLRLPTLPGWEKNPWLARSHVLVLQPDAKEGFTASLPNVDLRGRKVTINVRYTPDTGLLWAQ
jgi:CRISPR-associated endonuclease/helicase Cas3